MGEKTKLILSEIASQMGRKGGQSGTGCNKRRGNSSYYRDMQRKSVAARLRKTVQTKDLMNTNN